MTDGNLRPGEQILLEIVSRRTGWIKSLEAGKGWDKIKGEGTGTGKGKFEGEGKGKVKEDTKHKTSGLESG